MVFVGVAPHAGDPPQCDLVEAAVIRTASSVAIVKKRALAVFRLVSPRRFLGAVAKVAINELPGGQIVFPEPRRNTAPLFHTFPVVWTARFIVTAVEIVHDFPRFLA